MAQPIANILHQDTIRRLSGDGAFDRGRRYAAQGRVSDVVRREGAVTAKVRGSADVYDVRIWIHEGSLAYSCNCPQGQEQAFCKHAVAGALSFVGANPAPARGVTPPTPPTPLVEEKTTPSQALAVEEPLRAKTLSAAKPSISVSLRALSHEELVMLVLEEALEDDTFRARVLARLSPLS